MAGVVKKFKIGTAVLAAAAVTGLTPVLAQAAPDDSGTDTASVGSSAGKSRASRGATTRNGDTGDNASSNNDSPSTDAPGTDSAGTDAPSTDSADTGSAANRAANAVANATGNNPLLQNSFWWFGTPNPTPPPSTTISVTEPLADLPGWSRSSYGWFRETVAETCVLGLSNVTIGPYGTSTTSYSSQGC